MDDRIKLAEAMGYRRYPASEEPCWWHPTDRVIHVCNPNIEDINQLPDPFTDANDDYGCLQFAREQHFVAYMEYYLCMISESRTDYKIGDYARALLGVLDNEDG